MKKIIPFLFFFGLTSLSVKTYSQEQSHLHTSSEWEECSFQLDPSLTQKAWHQFTREAGLVAYFRPLLGAGPMGPGKIDVSVMQWQTRINEHSEAWNNTFVHPDSVHWLSGGPRLPIPGLSARFGITKKVDIGVYWTTNPWANYSIAGAQVQYNILQPGAKGWSAAARGTWSMIYGPRDLTFSIYGIDLVGSKKVSVYSDRITITPYATVSSFLSSAHERTTAADLKDENVLQFQGALGVLAQISIVQLAAEYNQGYTNTISYRIGVAFNPFQKKE